MDPALLREREAFKKRALSNPVVEKKKEATEPPKKKPKSSSQSKQPKDFNYKTYGGSSQYNFGILAKIVKHMKQRHLNGDTYPLTLEEILDETNQLDVGTRQRAWLINEALANNPKVQINADGKYLFKPPLNIKDRKSLLRLLDKHDQRGLGGITLDDVQESIPNVEKALKVLGDNIIQIVQPISKKKILFYNDRALLFSVDEEFQKLWRSVAVDGLDDEKIEEYLQKQGITSMQDIGVKKVTPVQKRKKPSNRNRNFKKLNQHMSDILQDYTDKN
ncbi:general transcription factor IIE subunit 2-like [Uloborus diversus]|uniref:general transcription factor IIE subunit 2-like n=1 Tax=Uloborus diversus TaxID=327109 RepID=UPI00240A2C11|nr:general transcription factor IIE subunit 2-like [Uloborus diversus]XP_054710307.1 general transcription factor IIE subunit 2-like [Uloborus diversus]XP_054710308.1 general transcription factor IIE subunit 2-like [Uloborus diversus]